ncbi:MAG: hypothetical protein ACOX7J_07270 [Bacillota bacterium]|jgi:hypothetical protein
MKILICVDDTDDLSKTTSTGRIAELIKKKVEKLGGVSDNGITRHQLLLNEKIAYTSHNSSMCFAAEIDHNMYENVKKTAENVVKENMAVTSNPGICCCCMDEVDDVDNLIAFGYRAQNAVISKDEAYHTAGKNKGIWLRELGGSGLGVIGALAGVGLRLSGNDGTFRGKAYVGKDNIWITADELCKKINVDNIVDMNGNCLSGDTLIFADDFIKKVYLNHKVMAVVRFKAGFGYVVCKKADLYSGCKKSGNWNFNCPDFVFDNDVEELYSENLSSCFNCLYRRWTADSFTCIKKKNQ